MSGHNQKNSRASEKEDEPHIMVPGITLYADPNSNWMVRKAELEELKRKQLAKKLGQSLHEATTTTNTPQEDVSTNNTQTSMRHSMPQPNAAAITSPMESFYMNQKAQKGEMERKKKESLDYLHTYQNNDVEKNRRKSNQSQTDSARHHYNPLSSQGANSTRHRSSSTSSLPYDTDQDVIEQPSQMQENPSHNEGETSIATELEGLRIHEIVHNDHTTMEIQKNIEESQPSHRKKQQEVESSDLNRDDTEKIQSNDTVQSISKVEETVDGNTNEVNMNDIYHPESNQQEEGATSISNEIIATATTTTPKRMAKEVQQKQNEDAKAKEDDWLNHQMDPASPFASIPDIITTEGNIDNGDKDTSALTDISQESTIIKMDNSTELVLSENTEESTASERNKEDKDTKLGDVIDHHNATGMNEEEDKSVANDMVEQTVTPEINEQVEESVANDMVEQSTVPDINEKEEESVANDTVEQTVTPEINEQVEESVANDTVEQTVTPEINENEDDSAANDTVEQTATPEMSKQLEESEANEIIEKIATETNKEEEEANDIIEQITTPETNKEEEESAVESAVKGNTSAKTNEDYDEELLNDILEDTSAPETNKDEGLVGEKEKMKLVIMVAEEGSTDVAKKQDQINTKSSEKSITIPITPTSNAAVVAPKQSRVITPTSSKREVNSSSTGKKPPMTPSRRKTTSPQQFTGNLSSRRYASPSPLRKATIDKQIKGSSTPLEKGRSRPRPRQQLTIPSTPSPRNRTDTVPSSSSSLNTRRFESPSPMRKSRSDEKKGKRYASPLFRQVEMLNSKSAAGKKVTNLSKVEELSSPKKITVPIYNGLSTESVKQKRVTCDSQLCSLKWQPNMHSKRDGCERCLFFVSEKEKENYKRTGHSPLIMNTRGGCDQACARFPRKSNEAAIRLCPKCFHDTHMLKLW